MQFVDHNGKIVLKDFNPVEALRIAMYIEEEGARFYRELTNRTEDKQIRNELRFLWDEEEVHRDNFEKLLRTQNGGDRVKDKDEDKQLPLFQG